MFMPLLSNLLGTYLPTYLPTSLVKTYDLGYGEVTTPVANTKIMMCERVERGLRAES